MFSYHASFLFAIALLQQTKFNRISCFCCVHFFSLHSNCLTTVKEVAYLLYLPMTVYWQKEPLQALFEDPVQYLRTPGEFEMRVEKADDRIKVGLEGDGPAVTEPCWLVGFVVAAMQMGAAGGVC